MEITEIAAGSSTKKQQHVIIEDLLAFNFDGALQKSKVTTLRTKSIKNSSSFSVLNVQILDSH